MSRGYTELFRSDAEESWGVCLGPFPTPNVFIQTFRSAVQRFVHGVALTATLLLISCTGSEEPARTGDPVRFVTFDSVTVRDSFWHPILERNRSVTIPHNLDMTRETGIVENFEKAAGLADGPYFGLFMWDAHLYKAVEAASYSLMQAPDSALETRVNEIVGVIKKAQAPNGYLNTRKQLGGAGRGADSTARWSDVRFGLELYFAGHLYEAAVAHNRATGKRTLLDVARKNAELVLSRFGPNKDHRVPGHQQIELALTRLYETTGAERYLEQSRFFIDERGNADGHELYGPFQQDHKPFVEQEEAVGQAPRATYLYSAAADVAYHMDHQPYIRALNRLWDDVVERKLYINGGIGSKHENEGFGEPYALPNLTAYSEICAAIGLIRWAKRMFRLTPKAEYFDVIERTLYNNLIAGVSQGGNAYFYACPLESNGEYKFNLGWTPEEMADEIPYSSASATRKEWFPCACCPPNLARYLPRVPGLVYAVQGKDVFVNLFIGGKTTLSVKGHTLALQQQTGYPWKGAVELRVEEVGIRPDSGGKQSSAPLSESTETTGDSTTVSVPLHIRIPGWARGKPVPSDLYEFQEASSQQPMLRVNGEPVSYEPTNGYAVLRRRWKAGDTIELDLPMPVRRVEAHPKVDANAGKVTLQRGPLIYALEEADHETSVLELKISSNASFTPRWNDDVLGGAILLEGPLRRGNRRVEATAIPYYLWSNRGVGEMAVWIEETTSK